MRVAYLASGAAGMYCGSCMRDNRLAATLIGQERDLVLMPMYTPLRTDETDVSRAPIYYGGINVFLQQHSALFRRLPRWVTAWLDAPAILRRAMRFSGSTSAAELGAMTVSILRGRHGSQRRELDRLIEALRAVEPDLVSLPFLMLAGLAAPLREALKVPVLCTLGGEDIFLDELTEPYRSQAFKLVRDAARDIDGFIAVTKYYGAHAATHFGLPSERVHFVPIGIHADDFAAGPKPPESHFTIGYLARVCPAKGLMNLTRALVALREAGRRCVVRAAGYLAPSDRPYLHAVEALLRDHGILEAFEYLGEVDRSGKIALISGSHVFSVPTVYREAKGVYVLEAMAAGVPVVQPRHGSFPEMIEATGGGLLYDPVDEKGLADSIARLMDDEGLRARLGESARTGVRAGFTDKIMADKAWAVYESYCGQR